MNITGFNSSHYAGGNYNRSTNVTSGASSGGLRFGSADLKKVAPDLLKQVIEKLGMKEGIINLKLGTHPNVKNITSGKLDESTISFTLPQYLIHGISLTNLSSISVNSKTGAILPSLPLDEEELHSVVFIITQALKARLESNSPY